jgi:hypothetical protein
MRIDGLLGGGVSAGDNRRRNRRVGRRRRFAAGSRYLDKAKARMGADSDGYTCPRNPTLSVHMVHDLFEGSAAVVHWIDPQR